jgi:hypothetical protein
MIEARRFTFMVILALSAVGFSPGWSDDARYADHLQTSSGASLRTGDRNEQRLAQGPFPGVAGARLGVSIKFENEVAITECFPIILSDIVIAWVADAHVVDSQLLISRCIEYDPSIVQTAGNRHGGTRVWERARLSDDKLSLLQTPVGAPDWGWFSNPSFCGKLVAYWGLKKDGQLTARIFDLSTGKEFASRQVGVVKLETDATAARPQWNDQCSTATFSGDPFVRGVWTLP